MGGHGGLAASEEEFREVEPVAVRELLRLRAAREAIGQVHGTRSVPKRGQQGRLADGDGHVIVPGLHPEVPGQAAAARELRDCGAGARQQALRYARIGLAVLLLVALPFTGSRAMVLITTAALMVLPLANGWLSGRWRREAHKLRALALGLAAVAGLVLVALSTLGWMRVDRLEEGRSAMTAQTATLATEAMPLGSGAGSFVPWFEANLPDAMLIHAWYNHAHNEYVQWWLEGGVAGLAWIALLLFGFAWSRPRRGRDGRRPDGAWVGSWLGAGCLLAHSVVDYPLRTPALATAGAWLAATAIAAALYRRRTAK